MHISKSDFPSLSKKDIIILNDVIHEIVDYSNELLYSNYIQEAKKILDTGLVISDFFLKIFGAISEKGTNNNNSKLSDKLKYPLSLKLLLLKTNFKILIDYENDYINGEKNLNEIIEIQLYLKSSSYYLASSKFYMAKIKFSSKNYEDAEKYALDAKNLFENYNSNKKDNNNEKKREEDVIEKKITKNVSNILSFLAQIYLIKRDYKNAGSCYENGYYLNLGRYGAKNPNTQYFKNNLDIINEEMKKYPSQKTQIVIKSNSPTKIIANNINNNTSNYTGNIIHKGKTDTFSFKIQTSSLYEPFLLSLYELGPDDTNNYASKLFLGNLSFDKQKLAKYLRLKGVNYNSIFYSDDDLNIILRNIIWFNGALSFLDKNLKNSLLSSSCPIRKNNK